MPLSCCKKSRLLFKNKQPTAVSQPNQNLSLLEVCPCCPIPSGSLNFPSGEETLIEEICSIKDKNSTYIWKFVTNYFVKIAAVRKSRESTVGLSRSDPQI